MKKMIFVLFLGTLIANVAYAQKSKKLSIDKLPAAVTAAFKAKFPAVTKATWELENANEYEAVFQLNNQEVSANFDKAGKWLETETEIKTSELPVAVQNTLKKEFPGYKISEAAKIESAKNGIRYEAEIKKNKEAFEVLFSSTGQVLSKKAIDEEND